MRRVLPIAEVAVVLALFVALHRLLGDTPFSVWQKESFGGALVTSSLLFFVLPLAFVIAGRKNPGLYGLAVEDLGYHRKVGLQSAVVLLPTGLLFPVIGLLGSTHEEWLGGLLLTAGVSGMGLLAVQRIAALDTREPPVISTTGALAYVALLLLGLLACFVFNLFSGILTRVVQKLIFVGFLEELFFRGYLQARLDDAFGRPCQLGGVAVGAGLFASAAIFGLAHPLFSPEGFPLPWALWTAAGGVVFGFLRAKTGAVVAPAIAHGLWVLPTAFFAP